MCTNSTKSLHLDCFTWIPEGYILDTIIFQLYINDLPHACPNVNIQMYTDDGALVTHANDIQEASFSLTSALTYVLHGLLDHVYYLITINTFISKNKMCMMFTKLKGEELVSVTKYYYLPIKP